DAVFDKENLGNQISLQTGTQIGTLVSLEVTKRGAGDIALQIQASGTLGSVTVETENRIRRALGGNYYQITKQDGTVTDGRELLPSAFFTVEDQGSRIVLHGGGFGHGIGMSQNGANAMAAQGLCCEEILKFFYTGVEVR
ncbi:MAG TPA: SpoIID/LytB domain-containing protein, partial [Lachnospiraceae bacterium]|nr:SpoIID/LytB domain-containing protein [Lachnospiraceae bacterium]